MNDASLAAANALVAGVAAGVARSLRGGGFLDGFRGGALGGLASYAGKRTAGFEFGGHRLVARQVSAVGTAMVMNAGSGRGLFDRLFLPYGPFALEIVRDGKGVDVYPSVDLYSVAQVVRGLVNDRLFLDLGASLRAGTVIFEGCCLVLQERGAVGAQNGGVVVVEEGIRDLRMAAISHEITHVMQIETIQRVWSYPVEVWITERAFGKGRWPREIHFGVVYPAVRQASGYLGIRGGIPPLESEARWVEWRKLR